MDFLIQTIRDVKMFLIMAIDSNKIFLEQKYQTLR